MSGVEYDEVEDRRNHLTLVEAEHIDFISRLTPRQTAQIARLSMVGEIMQENILDRFMMRFMRVVVSQGGKGREELVEAMKGDQYWHEVRDGATIPQPSVEHDRTRDRMRSKGRRGL